MKKTVLSLLALAFTISATAKSVSDQLNQPFSNKAVERVAMKPFLSNKRVQEIKTAKWDYVPGLVALSVLRTWEQYPDKREYYDAIKAYADNCLQGGDSIHVEPNNIDDIAAAKIFAILYKEELRLNNQNDAERYKRCAERFRTQLKYKHARIPQGYPGEGGFYHKGVYKNQMWLDGLFMGAAFWGEYEAVFADKHTQEYKDDWSDIANQFIIIHKYTYDKSKGLNYHAWSAEPKDPSSFWANQQDPFLGASPEFWGRGMGWYFAALVDVLEVMPKNHKDYKTLVEITNQVAEGLSRYQDSQSGCWFQLIQYDGTVSADGKGDKASNGKIYNVGTASNYIESSATALFNYGYYKGIRIGVLSKRRYIKVADRAYKGMIENFIEEDQEGMRITRSCASAGLGPAKDLSRTGTINYYLCGKDIHITQNEGKAIGAFILASVEREKLNRK
ncbi:MAG: glycoside hydrolase family 88/105 protein [Bacteroidales bacterium]